MIVCPVCNHAMLGSPDICEACGKLLPLTGEDTLVIESDELRIKPKLQKARQSAQVGESRTIKAHIDQEAVLSIPQRSEQEVLLGRIGEDDTHGPHQVTLTDYAASGKGVSRLHAALRLRGDLVQVRDMESTNGTFLNHQRVTSSEWRIVRDKDKLRLGNLVMTLRFN